MNAAQKTPHCVSQICPEAVTGRMNSEINRRGAFICDAKGHVGDDTPNLLRLTLNERRNLSVATSSRCLPQATLFGEGQRPRNPFLQEHFFSDSQKRSWV